MKTRKIKRVVSPRPAHFVGDGFRVHNFIPSMPDMDMKQMDPFIMFDYNSKFVFPPSQIPKGVGTHPHKGFETVTIAYKGRVEHTDNSGGGGVIGEGDVQWMTAASGVLHKEFHETEWSKTGGEFQMVQLWINLKSKDKKTPAKYQSIQNAQIVKYPLADNMGFIEVIAGEHKGTKGTASTFSPVHLLNLKAKQGAKETFSFPSGYTTLLLVLEGEIKVNDDKSVTVDHLALMEKEGEEFTIEITKNAVVLILSGEPLNEPIAHYGPFVMNTEQELVDAVNDFNSGKFGQMI